ncbi:hypothetical protein LIER_01980 [Lithospermum erythrorhizon]|uniref:Uncharacterized protein n=1 Tax=Lithospermum erythrorhizon TaxID=34254 RepID=A0AAV3NNA5_LITER
MKRSLSHKSGLIEGLNKEQIALKKELETTSRLSEERAKRVVDLKREPATEKEVSKDADNRRATEALEQVTKERDAALASSVSALVQFASQKIREFLANPNYAFKVSSECVAYFHALALDHKDRFSYLVILFDEEKASKPDWYRDLSLVEEGDSTDEEEAEMDHDHRLWSQTQGAFIYTNMWYLCGYVQYSNLFSKTILLKFDPLKFSDITNLSISVPFALR